VNAPVTKARGGYRGPYRNGKGQAKYYEERELDHWEDEEEKGSV